MIDRSSGNGVGRADRAVDRLYADMRRVYGGRHAGANGYRSRRFFRREQAVVLDALAGSGDLPEGAVLDIACGSGLMLGDPPGGQALARAVVGVDFNARACLDARANGLSIVRGDAFALPFPAESFAQAINCQFFNQQTGDARAPFLAEAARCLKPGGRLVLMWRKADSLLHRSAHAALRPLDRLRGLPDFPQHLHRIDQIAAAAEAHALQVRRAGVTLPFARGRARPPVVDPDALVGRILGASNLLVLEKRAPGERP